MLVRKKGSKRLGLIGKLTYSSKGLGLFRKLVVNYIRLFRKLM
jgi:hypothetical protein